MEKVNAASKKTNYADDDKNTDLHYAAALGSEVEVLQLINDGHEVDPVNYLGWTPLLMATRNGHGKVVQCLIEFKADSTKQNLFGFNILLLAVAGGKLEVTTIILNHLLSGGVSKRSLEAVMSPISLAIIFQNNEIFEYLVNEEFCANIKSFIGAISPVMIAKALNYEVGLKKFYDRNDNHQEKENHKFLIQNEMAQGQLLQVMHQQPQFRMPSPLYYISPTQHPFYSQPTPPMYNVVPHNPVQIVRGGSELSSPYYHHPSNMSPYVSPMFYNGPQVFFPPSFSPNQFIPAQIPRYNMPDMNKQQ